MKAIKNWKIRKIPFLKGPWPLLRVPNQGKKEGLDRGRMVTESRRLAVLYLLFFAAFPSDVTAASAFERQLQSRVTALPGQSFNVSFAHYSGYVTVNKEAGRALFYWFFEATEDPASKPLVLWLNGGPGCSSIAYGLAEELGPFHVKADGKSLYPNPYSWNQVANILFLDSPVGVGFSYANNSQDVVTNGDKRTAQDSLAFLKNWFKLFPQYRGREFYLTGESYAGHYVPQLAQAIVRSQKLTGEKSINLKGYMVGNALTDDYHDHYGVFHFMWTAGLISDQTYKLLNIFCDFQSFVHTSSACERILDIADKELGNIDPYSIFTPSCTANVTLSRNKLLKRRHSLGIIGEKYDPCTEKHSTVYFNLPEVQKALHVNPAYAPKKWETCSDAVNENWKDSESSVLHIYHELISQGLRIWIFSGDTDAVIPVASTRYNVNALKLPTVTPWHAWYDDGQVGGWTQAYKGLTFVTVRGAGHEVPLHQPKLALVLFKSFLSGRPMPTLTELNVPM
ncbi:serine carboxypeptidase II-2-like [Zingiber officinale]|uniref:serine carboxypeptidase II-2-like n=1 Tax=Zingiber officinale TaxID=94328 RepID=UPI001C4CC1D1|nr:serine carboxypeptidase II-2-like [Zingiber officinale]